MTIDKQSSQANQTLLDEINGKDAWFHARKTRPIWARRLSKPERVQTLEGEETVPAGTYLCRGEAADIWPQDEERLLAKYDRTTEVDQDGWYRFDPKPDASGVMAAQVPHTFQVQAQWGLLSGKPGDYLVKSYDDRNTIYPTDIWLVDQKLFGATYIADNEIN
ncbi:MAG: hypothetical protein U0930_04670 [Pirellulales bacterium]